MNTYERFRTVVKKKGGPSLAAGILDCSRYYIWLLSTGNRLPGRDLAVKISAEYGIPVSAWRKKNDVDKVQDVPWQGFNPI